MSLRYSIYKVQTRCFALAHSFLILSHSNSFVKNFFQVFSNLFEVFRTARCSLSNFAMLAHPTGFVKRFFQILFKSFRICCLFRRPPDDLHILAHGVLFVKHYFSIFSCLFLIPVILRPERFISFLLLIQTASEKPSVTGERFQITYIQTLQSSQMQHKHNHSCRYPPKAK